MNFIARAVLTLGLLGLLAFCVFGFLSSYEYAEPSRRLPWQIGYGTGGAVCLFATVLLWCSLVSRRNRNTRNKTNENTLNTKPPRSLCRGAGKQPLNHALLRLKLLRASRWLLPQAKSLGGRN